VFIIVTAPFYIKMYVAQPIFVKGITYVACTIEKSSPGICATSVIFKKIAQSGHLAPIHSTPFTLVQYFDEEKFIFVLKHIFSIYLTYTYMYKEHTDKEKLSLNT
jgi:hypothetical protein